MQLEAPALVITVLEMKSLSEGRHQRDLAAVFAYGTAQGADRVVALAQRRVIPAHDGTGRDTDIASGHRMRPGLLGKRADRCLERSAQGESSRASPPRRIENAPKGRRSNWGSIGSSRLLMNGVKGLRRSVFTDQEAWTKSIFCGSRWLIARP